ncbi:FimV/HubP family polar landmark protein [Kingella kingae]|uniref:FimV/HubP family polar landmark protein n=1 Tax=Kingella kingae TaxID=504 RepID=UPI00056FD181|nr:FimV/HubP family polar landmark protein [Kingella kingae]MDK4544879.1 FimV/HubP family polar landmark protein [Kingella kingae]MDK4589638.1 FimV/HubP family polar landmark protein [Kingella kingae]MDK4628644.1 FimV/HubP family polar landmark protein [Kingella kingae]MDK4636575.1 FimV/HubP family polar landmark protein [Kingella kingae]MDK4672165.1 FimV/HubP family polar landmark protein [Kingella kingae]
MKTNSKIIAASLSLMTSLSAVAGMGGVNVQSNLGEPFSGSIVVTGNEAKSALQGSVSVSGGLQGTVVPQGNGNAVIRLRSSAAVNEPVLNFVVKTGNQARQYTAMINPAHYRPAATVTSMARAAITAEVAAPNTVAKPAAAKANNQPAAEAAPVEKVSSRAVSPRYHRVRRTESAASIAARYRPHNMSVQRAMLALVVANPRAFHKGNPYAMYRNVTLYIPTTAQWYAYAERGQRIQAASAMSLSRGAANKVVAPTVTETPASNESMATEVSKPVEAAAKPEPKSTPAPTPAVMPEEKAPVQPASTSVAVEASTPTSVPVVEAVAETKVVASETVQAASESAVVASAVVASEVMASEPSSAPAPVVETPPAPAATEQVAAEQPVETEDETDWMSLGLMGGAAVLGLGGVGYLLSRRKKSTEEAEDEEEFVVDEPVVSTASAAAQRVWSDTNSNQSTFNDTNEDLFVDNAVKPSADSFNLNDFEPDVQVPEPQADEWLVTENAATDSFVEPEKEAVSELEEFDVFEPSFASSATKEESSDDMDWLAAQFSSETEEVKVEPESDNSFAELDLSDFNSVVEAVEPAPAFEETMSFDTAEPVAAVDDALNFDVSSTTDSAELFDLDTNAESVNTEDLDFNVPDIDTSVLSVPEVAEDALSFDLPATDTVAEEFSLDTPAAEDANLIFTDVSEAVMPSELAVSEQPAPVADFDLDDSGLDFLDDSVEEATLSVVEDVQPVAIAPVVEAAAADELLAWDKVESPEQQDVGFVSEAVGMAAPLEAKLELAKMYLEIDDAVAARETLRELIEESHGDLQAQAKSLLEELGG